MRLFWIVLPVALVALQGCRGVEPGQQCLDSFRDSLKDPESGKVISFVAPKLVYTATNSYGARTKGNALCMEIGGKWRRDTSAETMQAVDKSTATLETYIGCMKTKKTPSQCAAESGSLALKLSKVYGREVDQDALNKESRVALGF